MHLGLKFQDLLFQQSRIFAEVVKNVDESREYVTSKGARLESGPISTSTYIPYSQPKIILKDSKLNERELLDFFNGEMGLLNVISDIKKRYNLNFARNK